MKTKTCRGCEEEFPLGDFPLRKDRSNRRRPYCRFCMLDAQRARYKKHKRDEPFKHRCARARTRARSLGVPFDLTPEYLESLWTGKCPVRGVVLNLDTDRRDENAAELDRFNPDKGYTKGNVHWLSRKANRLKNNVSRKELINLLEWMEDVESD